jgi:hypothetical protein
MKHLLLIAALICSCVGHAQTRADLRTMMFCSEGDIQKNLKINEDLKRLIMCESSPLAGACETVRFNQPMSTPNTALTIISSVAGLERKRLITMGLIKPFTMGRARLLRSIFSLKDFKGFEMMARRIFRASVSDRSPHVWDRLNEAQRQGYREVAAQVYAEQVLNTPGQMVHTISLQSGGAEVRSIVRSTLAKEIAERAAANMAAIGAWTWSRSVAVLGSNEFFGAYMLFASSPTACAMRIPNIAYVNVDPSTCRTRYEVNKSVLDYLNLPENQQAEKLRTGEVPCHYYEGLQDALFPEIHLQSLECGDGFLKVVATQKNKTYRGVFDYNPAYRTVRFQDNDAVFRGHLAYMDSEDRLYTQDKDSEPYVRAAKMYYMSARYCCDHRKEQDVWRGCARAFSPDHARKSAAPAPGAQIPAPAARAR